MHFLRDMEGHCAKAAQRSMVKGAVREVFAAGDSEEAHLRLRAVATHLEGPAPKVAAPLLAAEEELLAHMAFPPEHWTKLRSTNPLAHFPHPTAPFFLSFPEPAISPSCAGLLRR